MNPFNNVMDKLQKFDAFSVRAFPTNVPLCLPMLPPCLGEQQRDQSPEVLWNRFTAWSLIFSSQSSIEEKKNVSISLSRVVICVLDIIDTTKFTQLSVFAVKVDPWVPSIHDNFKSKVLTMVRQKKWTPLLLGQFFMIRKFCYSAEKDSSKCPWSVLCLLFKGNIARA